MECLQYIYSPISPDQAAINPPPKQVVINQLYSEDYSTQPTYKAMTVRGSVGTYKIEYESSYSQTDYRENDTQTAPWAPPYVVTGTVTPEILTLTCLSWGRPMF